MVAAGVTDLMAANEGSSSSDSLARRSRTSTTNSIIGKKTASIRETKASRLRAASIVSPIDGSTLPRKTGFPDGLSAWSSQSATLYNKQKSPMSSSSSLSQASSRDRDKYHQRRTSTKSSEPEDKLIDSVNSERIVRRSKRLALKASATKTSSAFSDLNKNPLGVGRYQNSDSKDSTRRVSNHQSTSDSVTVRASSTSTSTTLASSSGTKRTSTNRISGHDSSEVLQQRVDALTARTRATMERVERLASSSSSSPSSSHAITPVDSRSTNLRLGDYHTSGIPQMVTSRSPNFTKQPPKNVRVLSSNASASSFLLTTNNLSSSTSKTINDEVQVISSTTVSSSRNQSALISILKHKSLDIETTTADESRQFVTLAVDNIKVNNKKHGILKKRSSLDENEILRRRNNSPDVYAELSSLDYSPISTNERRSSLDELVKRPRSPESHLTSILKRKTSGEDDREEFYTTEPQSILKRPSSGSCKLNSAGHHVSIAAAVAKTLGNTEFINGGACTQVRPILKKKISREESSSSDPPSLEPRPILKKKSSTESDEHEDKPKKTILKSSKKSSEDSSNESEATSPKKLSVLKNRALQRRTNSLPECDAVRSILKNSSSGRSRSSDSTRDLCLRKRARSVGHENTSHGNWNEMYDTFKDSIDVDCRPTPISSSLRCNNFTSSIAPIVSFKLPSREDEVIYCDSNAEDSAANDDETNLTNINSNKKLDDNIVKLRRARHISRRYRNRKELLLPNAIDVLQTLPKTVVIDTIPTVELLDSRKAKVDEKLLSGIEKMHVIGINKDREELDSSTLENRRQISTGTGRNVSQMALRFKAMEEERVKTTSVKESKLPRHNNSHQQRLGNDPLGQPHSKDLYDRFVTQPVTYQEVHEAVLLNQGISRPSGEMTSVSSTRKQDSKSDDVDPSKLSLADRVKLFNRRIDTENTGKSGVTLDRTQRRLNSRFRTQPVTVEEVEVASRNIPSKIDNLKRVPSESLGIVSTPETISQINNEQPKGILKSSSSHVLGLRNSTGEFIPVSESSSNSSSEVDVACCVGNDKIPYLREQEPRIVKQSIENESCNECCTDVNDGVVLRNKNYSRVCESTQAVVKSSSNGSKKNNTVPSSEYIDSNNSSNSISNGNATGSCRTTDSAHCISKNQTQRILNSRKFRRKSESESIFCEDKNYLASDITTSTKNQRPVSSVPCVDFPGMSIADRLAALQRSGTTDWKRRVTTETVPLIIVDKPIDNDSKKSSDLCQKEKDELAIKQRRLADRLEKLESAAEGWRKRVVETDAITFSVAGKMRVELPDSILPQKLFESMGNCVSDAKKKIPRPEHFRKGNTKDMSGSNEYLTQPTLPKDTSDDSGEESTTNRKSCSIQYVPRADDETFTSFFESLSVDKCREESIDVDESDFDVITPYSELLGVRRTTKFQRRHVSSRNPIKILAARTDIKDEYTEIITGVAERVMKMTNIEKLAQNSNLAVEALAGLASTENFNAITLKNVTDSAVYGTKKLRPYKELMLILVKGRRHVQVRLVQPVASSVNSGDNYILVTRSELYHYSGKFSNVIEKSRAADIALRIQRHKDLGCHAPQVITINEGNSTSLSDVRNFWKHLCESDINSSVVEAGLPEEDELYESALIATNVVYEVVNDELIPLEKYWGAIPKIKILDPSKILVFDFGSEMYIWHGKIASKEKRSVATRLAQELWDEGYDYSECTACPIDAASLIGRRLTELSAVKKDVKRPEWCLIAKLTQHTETILFREKFLDWPNATGIIKVKKSQEKEQVDGKIIVDPPDVNLMLQPNDTPVDLILEGCHLGRGSGWFDEEFSRQYLVTTTNVTVWNVDEYSYSQLDDSSVGQFFTGDSYIVRWMYRITITGRELSGLPSKHAVDGRNRCAYFIWQGKNSSLNQQGTAALLTVELDGEKGPHIRVVEGNEPAAFLNLFKGGMVVHSGKKSDKQNVKKLRIFVSRGAEENETCLIEVPCSPRQLKSRGSLVFVDNKLRKISVWHGRHSLTHIRENAVHAAQKLVENCPIEAGFSNYSDIKVEEIFEGEEPKEFVNSVMNKKLHMTLNKKTIPLHTPRLFHFSSSSGEFTVTELLCPHRSKVPTPFPFIQEEFYQANQPSLFLLDNKDELWLWQGWWPDTGLDDQTGSGAVRWQAERKAAMTVAIEYWNKTHSNSKKKCVYLIWAGLEPLEFINLFPTWTDRDDIAELNMEDGRAPGEILSVESELARLTQRTYPPAQLLQRPLPAGVDPTTLELYLSPQHFTELLGMNMEEFRELPAWKQISIKKEIGLF
ncbi:supervillin-like isoform X3 [Cotesia glomerata]|nr:supervillin-like isoform X3 [Cotesia glomerata]